MNHIVDMINMEMFTIDDHPISRDDQTWIGWYGSCKHLDNLRDVDLSGISLVIWLIELRFIMNIVKMSLQIML